MTLQEILADMWQKAYLTSLASISDREADNKIPNAHDPVARNAYAVREADLAVESLAATIHKINHPPKTEIPTGNHHG